MIFSRSGRRRCTTPTAETARHVTARTSTHRAIVVLTDGIDTSSSLTAGEVSGLASAIDVPVYIVATVAALDQRQMLDAVQRPVRVGCRRFARSR